MVKYLRLLPLDDMMIDMKTISVAISEEDYAAFRRSARKQNRSIAQLIREAMSFYRSTRLEERKPLRDLPVLAGHQPIGSLPTRAEVYEEIFRDVESGP